MDLTVTFVTLVAGIVTIIWFIRDIRKENSKVLRNMAEILERIEEGQRKGFQILSQDLKYIAELLKEEDKK